MFLIDIFPIKNVYFEFKCKAKNLEYHCSVTLEVLTFVSLAKLVDCPNYYCFLYSKYERYYDYNSLL